MLIGTVIKYLTAIEKKSSEDKTQCNKSQYDQRRNIAMTQRKTHDLTITSHFLTCLVLMQYEF